MAYEKNTWKTGDVVTSAKLNHMEDGIANGGGMMTVRLNEDTQLFDKTWQEVYDHIMNGGFVQFVYNVDNDSNDITVQVDSIQYLFRDRTSGLHGIQMQSGSLFEAATADSFILKT